MAELPPDCVQALGELARGARLVVALTGAGVSAESGIPTFRGPEGYWRVGSRNYRPENLATFAAFRQMSWEIWGWYLYRRGVCRRAEPNPAHRALAMLEEELGERMVLVTQNIDGLHLRAGSSAERTWQIHGHIGSLRCSAECGRSPEPIPEELDLLWDKARIPEGKERELLTCPGCGAPRRPHVLWMDEYYDEENYRFDSALRAAANTDLLLVAGTSGMTNLPLHMGAVALKRGTPMLVINLEDNPFSEALQDGGVGWYAPGTASELVPRAVAALLPS